MVAAHPYYLLLHGHDERDKNNADGDSNLFPIAYCCTGTGDKNMLMVRRTRIMLMMVAAQPYCLLLHGNDERDMNNTNGGSSSALLIIVARE